MHVSSLVYGLPIEGYQRLALSTMTLPLPLPLAGYCFYRQHEIALAVAILS